MISFDKPKGDLPVDIRPEILPITKRENLMNCLQGKTRNANASSMGWFGRECENFVVQDFKN